MQKTQPQELIPPDNFAMVAPGIYRSAYPNKQNLEFLQNLKLKTILYLCPEPYMQKNAEFNKLNNITLLQCPVQANKEPFIYIPEEEIRKAVSKCLDVRNFPILVHCNKGKHRTGVVVGCLRKMQKWSLTSIFDEYRQFAGKKIRELDQQFIELFDISTVNFDRKYLPKWLE